MIAVMLMPMEITAPNIEYGLLAPVLLIFAGACVGVLAEAVAPREIRRVVQLVITFVSLAAALATTLLNWASGAQAVVAVDSLALDGPTYFMWTILIIFSAAALLMFAETKIENSSVFAPQAAAVPGTVAEREAIRSRVEHTEVFPLALFALLGMMLFPASNDLITMFVALEILSLPLYLLCGLARRRRLLSQEAALKYFLLGALSSAFFIYGAALLYGYSGSFTLAAIDDALRNSKQGLGLLLAGMAMLGVGLLFKFGAVPFHSWTPDVYVGAPTPVTGFMAACTKIAASRCPDARFLRRIGCRPLGLAAGNGDHRGCHHGSRLGASDHPDRCEADARVLLDCSCRLHDDRVCGSVTSHYGQQAGRVDQRFIGDVLPGRVRGGDDRSIRPGDHGSRPNRRGDHAQQLDRAGSSPSAGSDHLLDLHAELRRNPADQRFCRQVGRVCGGLEWRGSVAGCRCGGDQRRRSFLLHPCHRADVFCRPEEDGDQRGASRLDHADGRRRRCSRDGSLRGISGPVVGPGPASR